MAEQERKYISLHCQWRGYTIKEFAQRSHIYFSDPDEDQQDMDDVAKKLFEDNKELIFQSMTEKDKEDWAFWDATGKYPTISDRRKNGGKDFEDTIKDKIPQSADDLDDYEMVLPYPCKLRIESHCITSELMISQTNFQTTHLLQDSKDYAYQEDDVFVFADDHIQEILSEEEAHADGVKKVEPGVTVFLWSKSMTRAAMAQQIGGFNTDVCINKTSVGWVNLSDFVVSMNTNVGHDGGTFNIRFKFLRSNSAGVATYKSETSDEFRIGGDIFRLSNDNERTWKQGKFARVETNTPDSNSFFQNILSPNDLIFLSFSSKLENPEDNKWSESDEKVKKLLYQNEYLESDDIAKTASHNSFDMICLVDNVVASRNSAQGEITIDVSGRDLSKLLIDDGAFFFNYSTTKNPSRIFYNEQGYARQGDVRDTSNSGKLDGVTQAIHRMRRPEGELDIFCNQVNQSIDYVIKGVLSQLANIEIVPSDTFEYWENRTKWLETHPDEDIQKKRNDRTATSEKKTTTTETDSGGSTEVSTTPTEADLDKKLD